MPRINIYEHSETYSFQTKNNSYATVAFPIAAIWGPTFVEGDEDANPDWVHFSSGYRGTTDFMATFRGANTYLGAREKSFDYALKLLAAGYDILVKRVDGLGDKSKNSIFVVPVGGNAPTPANFYTTLVPDATAKTTAVDYDVMPYRFYIPTVSGSEIVWNYTGAAEQTIKYSVTHRKRNATTGKWEELANDTNNFHATAKSAVDANLLVAFGKPNILTTEVKSTGVSISLSGKTGYGKQVVITGTVPVSVYTDDGTLLERRNLTITETSTYKGANADESDQISQIVVNSVLAPEFTYIDLDEIPALLTLKAAYDSTTNLFSSDASDAGKGLFTFRLGTSWEHAVVANLVTACGGSAAVIPANTTQLRISAKYPGTFGNNLKVRIKCSLNADGFKIGTVEVYDNNGYQTNPNEIVPTDQLLELVSVAFDVEAATDNRPLITEATFSNLDTPVYIVVSGSTTTDVTPSNYPTGVQVVSLLYGTDYATHLPNGSDITTSAIEDLVSDRFDRDSSYYQYISATATAYTAANDTEALVRLYNQQILYKRFHDCVGELTDPIVYDWDALVQGIADDQFIPKSYIEQASEPEYEVSTLVTKMIEVAANSKCGAALIGTPFGMPRGIQVGTGVNTVKSGALKYKDSVSHAVGPVYSTFGEVVGPWCKTTLALAGANSWIAPEIAHLLLIINAKGVGGQNKWWMIPAGMTGSGIVHTPEYKIKKKYLDLIQDHDEGVCLNPLMEVPGKGFTCFGNSTLWDKPLGTYNALQNLSTRFLTNRVKQRIWDTALQILFRYNNEDAYSHFYAGLSPLLDEMRAVGALVGNSYNPWGYRIIMNPDIVNLDRINANTVIGKVELAVAGVIDTVDVDLFLLPPTGFQETYD